MLIRPEITQDCHLLLNGCSVRKRFNVPLALFVDCWDHGFGHGNREGQDAECCHPG